MLLDLPLPLSQTVTPSRTPSPFERDVLYGQPLTSDHKAIIALSGGNIASLNKTRRRSHFRRRSQHASLLRELQVLDLDLPDIVHSGGLQEALGLFYADVHERLDRLYPVKGITMTSSEALTLTSYVLR